MAHCQKKCEKKCSKKCERYDSWSEAASSCDQPRIKKYERQVTITEVMFKKDECRRACKKSGYKVKCASSWRSVPCDQPKPCPKPKPCEKKCNKPVVCKKKQH
jgi:hypothetical protein